MNIMHVSILSIKNFDKFSSCTFKVTNLYFDVIICGSTSLMTDY